MRQSKKERTSIGELELVTRKLERWRIGHKGKSKRFPEELWREAAQSAFIHGAAAVASRLRLDYNSLKSRVDQLLHPSHREEKKQKFIEVTPLTVGKKAVSKIEFKKHWTKSTLFLQQPGAPLDNNSERGCQERLKIFGKDKRRW